jgi:hypothetical protein
VGKYLEIARRVSEGRQTPSVIAGRGQGDEGYAKNALYAVGPDSRRLLAAGWTPKVRSGKTIWASPRTGFWYSQEVALELVRLDERPPGPNLRDEGASDA